MAVIPYHHSLLNKTNLREFILQWENYNSASPQAEIISISKQIDYIEPLDFLEEMIQPNQVSFYGENQQKKEAVVAIGQIKSFEINETEIIFDEKQININKNDTENRFLRCQKFINYFENKIIKVGELILQNSPYFFAHFNFFNHQNNQAYNCFPLAKIFIPYVQLINQENTSILIINKLIKNRQKNDHLLKIFFDINNEKKPQKGEKKNEKNHYLFSKIEHNNYKNFTDNVSNALQKIEEKKINKIVVAHALELESETSFNIIKSLANLKANYPDCYIFSISNNREDFFIGASPERLLSIQNYQLITDALAGSSARGNDDFQDDHLGQILLNNDKEKREHNVVSDFLISSLSQLNLTPKKASLQLLKLSNIQHLWTPITASIPPSLKALEIITKLHPTPAVAGMPIKEACEIIKNTENFDRSLYAAPLGWIDFNGNCEFIVGIRSALIQGKKACLYAGAGIVAGSNPQQELREIKLKFQALLQALV